MTEISRVVLEKLLAESETWDDERFTKNLSGDAGAEFRFTAQSKKVCVPRIANTIVFMSSIGTDLITMALVPILQSAST